MPDHVTINNLKNIQKKHIHILAPFSFIQPFLAAVPNLTKEAKGRGKSHGKDFCNKDVLPTRVVSSVYCLTKVSLLKEKYRMKMVYKAALFISNQGYVWFSGRYSLLYM